MRIFFPVMLMNTVFLIVVPHFEWKTIAALGFCVVVSAVSYIGAILEKR